MECAERKDQLTLPQLQQYASKYDMKSAIFAGQQTCKSKGYPDRVWGGGKVKGGFAIFTK